MAKKKRQMIILLIVLTVAIAAIIAAVLISNAKKQDDEQEQFLNSQHLSLNDLGNIKQINFRYMGENVLLQKGDEANWSVSGMENFPLDEDTVRSFVEALETFHAENSFEATESLSAYGLDQSDISIAAVGKKGNEETFLFGKQIDEKTRYLRKESDDKTIYIVANDLLHYIEGGLNGLAKIEKIEKYFRANIQSISVGDFTAEFETVRTAVKDNSGKEVAKQSVQISSEGKEIKVEGALKELLENLEKGMSIKQLQNYSPNDTALKEYGINDGIRFQLKDLKQGEFSLMIGLQAEKQDAYYVLSSSGAVYLMEEAFIRPILEIAEGGFLQNE